TNSSSAHIASQQHVLWCTLGFVRSMATSPIMCQALSSPRWISLLLRILEEDHASKYSKNIYRQILILKLLRTVLPSWDVYTEGGRVAELVSRLFSLLGTVLMGCATDMTLTSPNESSESKRHTVTVSMTATYTSTMAEEVIALLRRLHTLPVWNGAINRFISLQLPSIISLLAERRTHAIESEGESGQTALMMAALALIGGVDSRLRLGSCARHEEHGRGTVCRITAKGRLLVQFANSGKAVLCRLSELVGIPLIDFHVEKMPLTEGTLANWAVLCSLACSAVRTDRDKDASPRAPLATSTGSIDALGNHLTFKELRKQYIRLCLLQATAKLFNHQDVLRQILSQHVPPDLSGPTLAAANFATADITEPAGRGSGEAGALSSMCTAGTGTVALCDRSDKITAGEDDGAAGDGPARVTLLQQLLMTSTQPSPLKAVFSVDEMEAAALAACQHLTAELGQAQVDLGLDDSSDDDEEGNELEEGELAGDDLDDDFHVALSKQRGAKGSAAASASGGDIASGTGGSSCVLTDSADTPTVEALVSWLLEHPAQENEDSDTDLASSEEAYSDSDSLFSDGYDEYKGFDHQAQDSLLMPSGLEFKKRSDFANTDDYAIYVRQKIQIGMMVRCCRTYEEVHQGDIGKVTKLDQDGLHELNIQAHWQRKGGTYWVRYIHVEILGLPNTATDNGQIIKVGDKVRVKPSVKKPTYKWGSVTHASIGTVTGIMINGQDITVDFPQQAHWTGVISEMELVPSTHPMISCNKCFMNPISGPRFHCQTCEDFDLCEGCFKVCKSHKHPFNRIQEPGSDPVFAGKPGRPNRAQPSQTPKGSTVSNWHACVKSLTVSSREDQAHNLIDGQGHFWQSHGTQGKHWIRLEMQPDMVISKLVMRVDPNDSSYIPSLLVISGGDSVVSLKEIKSVHTPPNEAMVTLLQDMTEYYRIIEIGIRQCRSSGIDCKIHGLSVVARVRSDDDYIPTTFSILAQDKEGEDEEEGSGSGGTSRTGGPSNVLRGKKGKGAGKDIQTYVFVWGLNDKDQLGGPKGSKIKMPMLNEALSTLNCIQIAGGSKSLFCVTQDGKLFACGEGTNGRLGLGTVSGNISVPRQLISLSQYVIKKVAVHSGGRHALALSIDGKVFAWGEGDDGKLGLSSRMNCDTPKLLEALKSKRVRDIACGSSHSAAIISNGDLYTWGLGDYGRLGHGDNTTQLKPKQAPSPDTSMVMHMSTIDQSMNESINLGGESVDGEEQETDLPFPSMQTLAAKVSAGTSILAETLQSADEVTKAVSSFIGTSSSSAEGREEVATGPSYPDGLDEFTSRLTVEDARILVELLKLSVARRFAGGKKTLAYVLTALARASSQVTEMLLELCVTELEDVATDSETGRSAAKPVVQESAHPYTDDSSQTGVVRIPGAEALRVEFDRHCSTERRHDPLTIMDATGRTVSVRSGREWSDWFQELRIFGDELRWKFTSDGSVNGWGWSFTVYPIMPAAAPLDTLSDRTILARPSIDLVTCLLDFKLEMALDRGIVPRLAAALAACAQLSSLGASQRMWALHKLRKIMAANFGNLINITALLSSPTADSPEQEVARPFPLSMSGSALASLVKGLPEALQRQYEYEDSIVRSGKHLMHSPFFKVLVALACDLGLDKLPCCAEAHKWAWFRRYCNAARVAVAMVRRLVLPGPFTEEVLKKIQDIASEGSVLLGAVGGVSSRTHERHDIFRQEHDEQLLQWINRKPDDWTLSWGGSGQIFVWGHNHRGQLGGVEGAKVKLPLSCDALATLRPVQLIGGEQTLFAVTADGKVYGTGYGAGGRLGVGGTDSVATPTLLESLQHVFVKKLAVNSGGKHCLALSAEGEVYSWGEGEDGKLGHGNKSPCDRPRVIECLRGKEIVDIAAGGAHSACITSNGELYTWGKGRYGRLGHGDSEDQARPKMLEALKGYRVVDVACGSGDAQTLCITDDDNVWSWGDGDYGKLGRGGSDGCKVPMKVEALQGLGVVKVECGSQFSVALTDTGVVYTWGKGDYHRLGHGTDDHVRRPRRVNALQGKKVIDVACGSLHCVACTETGEVFTWGDNDEGQLGDGTTNAIQRPRLVAALQGKKINRVACGSAHSLAWSTHKPVGAGRLPAAVPMEYNHLQGMDIAVLRNRLVLLHHFSELFCPCIPMMHLQQEESVAESGPSDHAGREDLSTGLDSLRGILMSSAKEAAFRKVVHATMVREKQHGPVIELNRIQVKRSRVKGGLAGPDGLKSVFGQMSQRLSMLTKEVLMLPHRVWKVKFVGEGVDDCGGGYSESIVEMCEELQNGSLSLLIVTPNGRDESGANRDCFLLNPSLHQPVHQNMFKFLGILIGIAIRSGSPLSLNIAEPCWKQLAGMPLSITDLSEIDKDFLPGLMCIKEMDAESLRSAEMPFSIPSATGHEVQLSHKYSRISPDNRLEYVKLAMDYRLHEFDEQVRWVREGMAQVVPVPLLSLSTGYELEKMVCGSQDIPLSLLKSVANYKGIEPTAPLVQWFWEVMDEFTNAERSLFLRFVWGRTRLPRTIADFRGRDFVLQVLDKYNPPDNFLPESYTCFFLLKMPRYSSKAVLRQKLKYAVHFCKSIDTDDYARVALTGDALEEDTPEASEAGGHHGADSVDSDGEILDSDAS
ncbi:E3 ubiquitin-protein ligase HERC2, partial [Elysia marginata]